MEIFVGLLLPFLGTALGAGCVFFLKGQIKPLVQKTLLGFASGVMVAASVWSLLIPAMDMSEGMGKLGFFTFASEANYIFFKGPWNLQEKCLDKGIYIRDCSNYRGLRNGYYRVAVRTGEENEELLKVFKQILEQNR